MERAASTISRRNVVVGLASLAVTAVAATTLFKPSAGDGARRLLAGNRFTRRFLSLASAEQAEWAAQVGSDFTVEGGYRMRLVGVRPLASSGARPAGLSRSRAFAASTSISLANSIPVAPRSSRSRASRRMLRNPQRTSDTRKGRNRRESAVCTGSIRWRCRRPMERGCMAPFRRVPRTRSYPARSGSTNRGRTFHRIELPIAQMYHVTVDTRIPYYVYGNRQDGHTPEAQDELAVENLDVGAFDALVETVLTLLINSRGGGTGVPFTCTVLRDAYDNAWVPN